MNKFNIFIILTVSCLSHNYSDGLYYRSRHATNRLSSLSTPYLRTLFGRTPFSKPPLRMNRFRAQQLSYSNHLHSPAPGLRTKIKSMPEIRTELPSHPNYSLSVFGFIKEGQNGATKADTMKWRWIARIMPTKEHRFPMICTAACVEERIFITAAICIYKSKLVYTRVIYQDHELQPIAFVLPSNQTKQMFDDVGIIVVDKSFKGTWHTNKLSPFWAKKGRSDNQFMWHAARKNQGPWHKAIAIGFVSTAAVHQDEKNETEEDFALSAVRREAVNFTLYQLEVKVSNFLCNYIYTKESPSDAYFVPCYSPCDLVEHFQDLPKCHKYLAGLGHIVVWTGYYTIIGISTWGGYSTSNTDILPIGLSVTNSDVFKGDLKCAEKIRDAPNTTKRFVTICK